MENPAPVHPDHVHQPEDPKTRAENRWENEGGGVDPVKEPEPDDVNEPSPDDVESGEPRPEELPPEHPVDH
jgi:hypothetical protein